MHHLKLHLYAPLWTAGECAALYVPLILPQYILAEWLSSFLSGCTRGVCVQVYLKRRCRQLLVNLHCFTLPRPKESRAVPLLSLTRPPHSPTHPLQAPCESKYSGRESNVLALTPCLRSQCVCSLHLCSTLPTVNLCARHHLKLSLSLCLSMPVTLCLGAFLCLSLSLSVYV